MQPNAIRNKSLEILSFLLIVVNILKEHLVFEATKNSKRPLQEVHDENDEMFLLTHDSLKS